MMNASQMGKKGAAARIANLTPQQLSAQASKAGKARWAKARAKGKKK